MGIVWVGVGCRELKICQGLIIEAEDEQDLVAVLMFWCVLVYQQGWNPTDLSQDWESNISCQGFHISLWGNFLLKTAPTGCSLEMRQHQGNSPKGLWQHQTEILQTSCGRWLGLDAESLQAIREITSSQLWEWFWPDGKEKGTQLGSHSAAKERVIHPEVCQQCTLCNLMVYKPLMFCREPLMEMPQHNPSWGVWSLEKEEPLNIPGEYTGLTPMRQDWQSVPVRGSDKVAKTDVVQLVQSRSGVLKVPGMLISKDNSRKLFLPLLPTFCTLCKDLCDR